MIRSLLMLVMLFASSIVNADNKVIWLDDMEIEHMSTGWSTSKAKSSIDGNPITIAGQRYNRGVGTHANSELNIKLDGKANYFRSQVGLDSEVTNIGSVEFIVTGDGNELFNSGIMSNNDQAISIKLNLEGIKLLKLIVSDAGDGVNYDHADWVNAQFEYSGAKPEIIVPIRPEPYILTPKPGPEPRITGPKIFGARPGNPFLFTVTATGKRPMTFDVIGLPKGLKLDSKTGIITGSVAKVGEYTTTVVAKNSLGVAKRKFKIEIGNKICLTPPMGWNSWNCWARAVDDQKIRDAAKMIVDTGLINHGWSYVNIDDCWMRILDLKEKENVDYSKKGWYKQLISDDPVLGGTPRNQDGDLIPNNDFPDMFALTDYIHSLGLKAGTYIGPGPWTCQGYIASWQYEEQDAAMFAQWGFDYLKYDWCGYSQVSGNDTLGKLKKPYEVMREALAKQPRDIVYSICQYGWGDVYEWGEEMNGNCWRTTGDIVDSWSSLYNIGFSQAPLWPYAKPGQWNDPDMLIVGHVGWGPNLHPTRLTPDEQYTHISLWCMLSAPLLIGCDLTKLDEFTLSLLTNDEVLEINQDTLGRQARRITVNNNNQVWVKELDDGGLAVAIFNLDSFKSQTITVPWSELGISGEHVVRDLWRQKDHGIFDDSFTANEIPAHGVKLIKISK